jgi:hypothetical protein
VSIEGLLKEQNTSTTIQGTMEQVQKQIAPISLQTVDIIMGLATRTPGRAGTATNVDRKDTTLGSVLTFHGKQNHHRKQFSGLRAL